MLLATVTGMLTAGILAVLPGASAQDRPRPLVPPDSTCYSGLVCMFEDEGYYGDRYEFSGTTQWAGEIGGWNGDNEISSVKNYSSYFLCLYEDDSQGGDWVRIGYFTAVYSLDDSFNFDNDAESFRLTNGGC